MPNRDALVGRRVELPASAGRPCVDVWRMRAAVGNEPYVSEYSLLQTAVCSVLAG
jgi:hypothetical protein